MYKLAQAGYWTALLTLRRPKMSIPPPPRRGAVCANELLEFRELLTIRFAQRWSVLGVAGGETEGEVILLVR